MGPKLMDIKKFRGILKDELNIVQNTIRARITTNYLQEMKSVLKFAIELNFVSLRSSHWNSVHRWTCIRTFMIGKSHTQQVIRWREMMQFPSTSPHHRIVVQDVSISKDNKDERRIANGKIHIIFCCSPINRSTEKSIFSSSLFHPISWIWCSIQCTIQERWGACDSIWAARIHPRSKSVFWLYTKVWRVQTV